MMRITSVNDLPVSCMERTLIDITIRPYYAGGTAKVLEAYQKMLPTISIESLIEILDKLDFIYPYHQSIGWYLSKTGANDKMLKWFINKKKNIDFYLDYNMKDPLYDKTWKLFYPAKLK